jgi:hypothetical protein
MIQLPGANGRQAFLRTTIPAGTDALQDGARPRCVTTHPNVAPLCCRQLIQRLVPAQSGL